MKDAAERIMFYWTGVDSDFCLHPDLLTLRREFEAEYCAKVLDAFRLTSKGQVEVYCMVWIDNAGAVLGQGDVPPEYRYKVNLVVTPPVFDSDMSLSEWISAISSKAGIPFENIGIQYRADSSYSSVYHHDERVTGLTGWDIVEAYCKYVKRMDSRNDEELLRFYLESGIAEHIESVGIIQRNLKQ